MDGSAVSAGPWLVLGAVVGLLLALVLALAVDSARGRRHPLPPEPQEPSPADGWVVDDLPGWLDDPAGAADGDVGAPAPLLTGPAHLAPPPGGRPATGRTLVAMALGALLLVGAAATVAALTTGDGEPVPTARDTTARDTTARDTTARDTAGPTSSEPPASLPALPPVPDDPDADDPGAGRLAGRSVPVGADGALADLAFEGIVLERRAVGVTAAYPALTLTAAAVPGGPAVAHVELPTFNCLTDSAPADPVAAGCLRTPVEYADLPTPALTVTHDGEGLLISGRFPTYLRPSGSDPEWTGRVHPMTVTVAPGGPDGGAEGALQIGSERAGIRDEPGLNELRVPG